MKNKSFFGWSLLFLIPLLGGQAFANVGEGFGFGSRVAGLGGIGVVGNAGPFAAYHNPAELSVAPQDPSSQKFQIAWGLLYMQPTFSPINNVVTQNKFNSDAVVYDNVDTTYRETVGQVLALSYREPALMNLSFGLVTFAPLDAVAYMDSGEGYVPEYVLYRARTQRPQIEFGLGIDLGNGFHFGAGLHFGFTLTGNATVFVNTRPGTTSSMRFTTSLKPKAGPYFGFLFKPVEDPESLSLGAVLRLPVESENTLLLRSAARVFGDFAAVDFNFPAKSVLFYDPMALEVGGTWKHSDWGKLFAQADYQIWRSFKAPALLIQDPNTVNCKNADGSSCVSTVPIAPGQLPGFEIQNIVIPRVAEEIYLNETTTLRVGYAYRPSIFAQVPNEAGNYLDPPKHMMSLGLGLNYQSFFGNKVATHLDFHLGYQLLESQHVTKTSGNEGTPSDPNDPKIGSPGYDVGGNLLGGGVSLSFAF